jgi:hypothetical protein
LAYGPRNEVVGRVVAAMDTHNNLRVIEASKYFIFAWVECHGGNNWLLGAIYGDAGHTNNERIWNKIRSYTESPGVPLCCIRDFNAISSLSEKYGGSASLNSNHRSFCDLLLTANLIDLGYKGPAFTWTNSRYTSDPIFERLDRAIVITSWQENFSMACVNHLPMIYRDHAPILLRTNPMMQKRGVRIEYWWLRLNGFGDECKRLWEVSQHMAWEERHKYLCGGLKRWARSFPLPVNRLKQLERDISAV